MAQLEPLERQHCGAISSGAGNSLLLQGRNGAHKQQESNSVCAPGRLTVGELVGEQTIKKQILSELLKGGKNCGSTEGKPSPST